ncbi:fungal-specific transcription factor domain-containing protein [Aspergillus egyptiacus]|nr:fungal-specific transcription factor domain-containing protein [Aspergillus egyptiacus]
MSDNPYPYDTARVSEILKHKRKHRGIRSCFPCRHRKVRCDGQVPCSSCVKRNHSELCRVPTASALEAREKDAPPTILPDPVNMISRLERIEEQITALKADLRAVTAGVSPGSARSSPLTRSVPSAIQPGSPGRHVLEDATGATIYLGSHSDSPLALGCREASVTGDLLLHSAMLNQFVPRTYPFTSLWGPDATTKDVCETLPDDSDMIRYWQAYRSTAFPFYPVLVAADEFGLSLFTFLNNRVSAKDQGQDLEPEPSWLALLFAVMACGVQFTDDPPKERDLRSKVFICSSFQILRMSNFFNHTDLNQIQAMALIGHCLRNNLDTNSAWILMGAAIRLAQSIGLHEASLSLPQAEQVQRTWLWWALIWQDTFLSFTYDRPPSCLITRNCPIPYTPNPSGLSFHECIFRICHIILDQAQQEATGRASNEAHAADAKRRLEGVWDAAAPFLTDKMHCTSLQNHLERLALGIHLNYSICRVTLVHLDTDSLAMDCRSRAMQVIECFLELHRFSPTICRAWAFVHNAVSCAITLHRLSQVPTMTPTEAGALAQRLIVVLEKEARNSEWYDADTNVRYFGPYSRSLNALREVYSDLE